MTDVKWKEDTAKNFPIHELIPVKATTDSLRGYGQIIGEPNNSIRDKIDFYGNNVVVAQPAEFHGNDDLCLNLVSFRQRPLDVQWMEYHTKHTQTFIPLSGKPFYMVLGKPTIQLEDGSSNYVGSDIPEIGSIKAFEFDGTGGIVMNVGTWHEVPFPASGTTHFVCICTNETNDNLEHGDSLGECDGGDLTKRHMETRLGVRLRVRP